MILLNTLAHAARILVAGRPDHPRAEEYARVLDGYRVQWSGASEAQKKQARTAALKLDDMDDERIDAAIAALEG